MSPYIEREEEANQEKRKNIRRKLQLTAATILILEVLCGIVTSILIMLTNIK